MPGLLDVAPSTKTVDVDGTAVVVTGVSALGVAYLFERFPVLREVVTGRQPELTPESLFKLVPEAVAAIIACGTGDVGSVRAEEVAATLPVSTQLELLDAILDKTLPKGVGPFVDKLAQVLRVAGVEPTSIQDTKSPKESKP